ncbi:magnesium or manganese-dependent protein phosphatase [Streptomyces bingchenggensis BCW-1]|uniref:Magnesium or manganese-dependent protein phosphatase n=1 Tax=Streptomyces bingchenggensis (strain BCW-1) TaxID=749414 RepID=D7BW97_STRBB|nr:magnesium or manganese-dependent protein phosphatase [Streptomyces bingchenggensis BCW-1]
MFTDATERRRARRRLELRQEAATRIGGSLSVARTAQDLANVLVPALGDLAHVDLAEAVLEGDEPPKTLGGGQLHMRRAAVASAAGPWPASLLQPGDPLPPWPDSPGIRSFQRGEIVFASDRASVLATLESWRYPLAVPECVHSVVSAPVLARNLVLGEVTIWRTEQAEPFEQEDADLLAEIASRAALSVDNARRYTREHRAAVALQQRLLPRATPDTPAAETVGFYRPAGGGAEISGDWYDVIPLPSLRVAFVVGDVLGHGLPATATMGRLRTAVHTLADLELDPTELLTHLDDLVQQLAGEAPPEQRDSIGATCLYAVYDPVTGHCTLASAGHLPPLVVRPGGTTEALDVSPGPPLGVGGMPFETTTVDLAPDSAGPLHRRVDRPRRPRSRCRHPLAGELSRHTVPRRPESARHRPCPHGRPRRRPAPRRHDPAPRPCPRALRGAHHELGVPRGPGRGHRRPTGHRPPAGRLGTGRAGLHHRTGRQRAGHQRHPLRRRPGRPAAHPQERTGLRGHRPQQHPTPPTPCPHHRRRGPRPFPDRTAHHPLGQPLRPKRQDHLDRTAPHHTQTLRAVSRDGACETGNRPLRPRC